MATRQRTVDGPQRPMARGSTDDVTPIAEVADHEVAGHPASVVGCVVRDAPERSTRSLGRVTREAAGPGVWSIGCVVRDAPERGARALGRVTTEVTGLHAAWIHARG